MNELCAQLRPADTTAATLYAVGEIAHDRQRVFGKRGDGSLTITNTTTSEATCRVFLDPTGANFDEETVYYCWDCRLPDGQPITIPIPALTDTAARLGVRSGTASALTFVYISASC